MLIGRRIYYDIETGNVLIDTGERQGSVISTATEQDIRNFKVLSERNQETFNYLELEYGQYAQDFEECNGYRVNPKTKEIEFSYPDPNEEGPQEPVYQPPLSEEVKRLTNENKSQDMVIEELMFVIIPELNGGGI